MRLTTLDNLLAEQGIGQVDFLKIDTEGHDLFVLKGFPFSRVKPDVILCELEDAKSIPLGYDFQQMGDYSVEKGDQVFLSEGGSDCSVWGSAPVAPMGEMSVSPRRFKRLGELCRVPQWIGHKGHTSLPERLYKAVTASRQLLEVP